MNIKTLGRSTRHARCLSHGADRRGEIVKDAIPYIGYMHRGGEKLSESLDYRGALGYQDRTDYLAAFNSEWVYVNAVERLAGIEIPERAEYIRLILSEFNRIMSHFMFMGAFGTDVGYFGTAFTWTFKERERIQDLFEAVCGDRIMYNYFPMSVGRPGSRTRPSSRDCTGCSTR